MLTVSTVVHPIPTPILPTKHKTRLTPSSHQTHKWSDPIPETRDGAIPSYFASQPNATRQIPSGRQLDTLYMENTSMYDGNSGLCGHPLPKNCSGTNSTGNGNQKLRERDPGPTMYFYIGVGSGFTVGLWTVFFVMLFKTTWRIAYFLHLDKIYGKAYVFVMLAWRRFSREATED